MYWSHFVNMTHPFICNFIIVCITHLISLATFQIRVWEEMLWEEKKHHPSCAGVSHRAQACHRVGLHPCWGAQAPKCCWSSGSQLWCRSGQPPYCPTWGWCQAWGWCFLRSRLHCWCCLRNRNGNFEKFPDLVSLMPEASELLLGSPIPVISITDTDSNQWIFDLFDWGGCYQGKEAVPLFVSNTYFTIPLVLAQWLSHFFKKTMQIRLLVLVLGWSVLPRDRCFLRSWLRC